MSFLPKDYKEPTQSNYMSFEEGDNTFRILDTATIGWEYWTEKEIDGEMKSRPVRVKEHDSIPLRDVNINKFGNLNLSFFWAFPVYNFDAGRIQILTIKQKTVRRGMEKNIKNPKWGDPREYNFVVSREKDESGKTVYTVTTEPKEELDQNIVDKFKSMKIDMQAWMSSDDPFKDQKDDNGAVDDSEDIIVDSDAVAEDVPF